MTAESRRPRRTARPLGCQDARARGVARVIALVLMVPLLAACASVAPDAPAQPSDRLVEELAYWSDADDTLLLDACLPAKSETASAAVILLHGGGFTEGNRVGGGMRALCEAMAQHGVAGFSIDYRLAPDHRYPSQVDDTSRAIEWLRAPEQTERFGIDPARIGLLGSSAGAIIAQSVGTAGTGPTDAGARVDAVVSLSGVSLMTEEAMSLGTPGDEAVAMILAYLGCTTPSASACPQAEAASPVAHVDPSDPPVLLVTAADELVPVEQAERMHDTLNAAGVPSELVVRDGAKHGVQLLDASVRTSIVAFFARYL